MNAFTSRLLAALAYPRAIDDWVELALPLHSSREVRARVVEVRPETHDMATLVLRPNALWRGHRAGQYVALTVEVRGVRRTRCFSIASAEHEPDGTVEITVKARPGGAVTPHIVSGSLRGAIVTLSVASGDFVLPDVMPERTLLLSGGSGITPVMSMLRTLVAGGHDDPITFVHYARSAADVPFRDELSRIAGRPGSSVRVIVRTGAFEADGLAELVPDFDRRETWACGPAPFLSAVTEAFANRGAADRVRVERFALAAMPGGAGGGEVTFARSGKRTAGSGSLLATAEASGLAPPSGCRMGICRTCVCRKLSGTTRDLRTGELSTDADADIQLCVSAPVGAVAIDI
jgi:ferredoxin-NADP reductase